MKPEFPFDYWRAGFELTRLGVEAQAVIAMRLLGLGGIWNTPFDEGYRMWREKPQVFAEATGRATEAAMRGAAPAEVMAAAIRPLSRDVKENRHRLQDRGYRSGLAS